MQTAAAPPQTHRTTTLDHAPKVCLNSDAFFFGAPSEDAAPSAAVVEAPLSRMRPVKADPRPSPILFRIGG